MKKLVCICTYLSYRHPKNKALFYRRTKLTKYKKGTHSNIKESCAFDPKLRMLKIGYWKNLQPSQSPMNPSKISFTNLKEKANQIATYNMYDIIIKRGIIKGISITFHIFRTKSPNDGILGKNLKQEITRTINNTGRAITT